jgi:4-nitrophenyl phosphatase
MTASTCAQARHLLDVSKAILLDWDGCVAVNNRILSDAAALIARHLDRVAIVSNNSTHLPDDFAEVLAASGLAVPRERIFMAGVEALRHVAALGEARVLLLAAPKMRRHARDLGLTLVREEPDLVLLMRDARFTYAKLERAANALRDGARLVVANGDLTHPGPAGRLVPETGALLAALLACVGEQRAMPVLGKPGPLLFQRACDAMGVTPRDAVMIGDNPATDGEGARRLGMRSIIVGAATGLRMEDLLPPVVAPLALLRSA